MNNAGQKIVVGGICRPDGAWPVCGVLATKMSLLAEEENGDEKWSWLSYRKPHIKDSDWRYFWAEIGEPPPRRTRPFTVVFAYRLDSSLTLDSLKQRLQKIDFGPNLVVVLSKGLVVRVTQGTLDRIRGLREQRPSTSYRFDFSPDPEFEKIFQEASKFPSVKSHYLTLDFNDESNPLLFFYAFLMDYLAEQRLVAYLPSDLLTVWRKLHPLQNESHP
jgi:hypothetical protein